MDVRGHFRYHRKYVSEIYDMAMCMYEIHILIYYTTVHDKTEYFRQNMRFIYNYRL